MIVDAHIHLSQNPLSDAKLSKLLESMNKNNIDMAIALAAYFPRKNGSITNSEIISLTEGKKNILIFGSLDTENNLSSGLNELEKLFKEEKIAGIKLYPGYQFIFPNDPKLNRLYAIAVKFDVPVMFHSGLVYRNTGKMKYTDPYHIDEVATEFPDLKIIISHLGDPEIGKATSVAHKNKNVYLDISGLISNTTKSRGKQEKWQRRSEKLIANTVADVIMELMGTEKIIFGTDWPISSHESYIELARYLEETLNLDKYEKEQMMSENIKRLLNI